MKLADDQMWEATKNNDGERDGQFFYAVKTVGVYCRPSCKSRTPLRKNVVYFVSSAEAEQAGFRPCKRCRPDLMDYAPVLAIAERTKALMNDCFTERERLSSELASLGISRGHLAVIFKQQYGASPTQYLNHLRLSYAKRLLARSDMPIIDIALEIGYDSVSAFYGFFKRQTGITPQKFRRKFRSGDRSEATEE
jgi:AraC family transcriptional regulator of adaptative response / methylphosphotriester-DNA alkyltransferase methyltransferase